MTKNLKQITAEIFFILNILFEKKNGLLTYP
jgi:hypothetical protein